MWMQLMLLLVYLIRTYSIDKWASFYVYETDNTNAESLQHHCLYYYVTDDIVNYGHDPYEIRKSYTEHHQLIPYCIRAVHAHEWLSVADEKRFINYSKTFAELRLDNVTSEQLYSMSAPIDLVERYQIYLEDGLSFDEMYYNCFIPWFGSSCQFTFDFGPTTDFSDSVQRTFQAKYVNHPAETMTCYIHLQCDRGLPPSCLDWREVCNGIIDCKIDGEDEKDCWQLEMNECDENEYRYHNGAQCIPDHFLRDDSLSPECQDRTDESEMIFYDTQSDNYPDKCYRDPAFRCEEITCRSWRNYRGIMMACGDGTCGSSCHNMRESLLKEAMLALLPDKFVDKCWFAMICLTKISDYAGNRECSRFCAKNACILAIVRSCPSLFEFPVGPVLFSHVHFIYTINQTLDTRFPAYICYNNKLCDGIVFCSHSINVSACCQLRDLDLQNNEYTEWSTFIEDVHDIFRFCSATTVQDGNEVTLYRCANSSKFISKHRLLDGIRDCIKGDDETYEKSCALNHRHRFECTGENKCIASHLVGNKLYDCSKKQDESSLEYDQISTHISFQTICDGFQELDFVEIDGRNETDETECDQWRCNNTYTNCNEVWNCPRGIDEINCYPSRCPSLEHMCVSPLTYNLTCLPIAQVENGIIDCLGASDERQLCRDIEVRYESARFLCWNDTRCMMPYDLCNSKPDCKLGDDEHFCTNYGKAPDWLCAAHRADHRTQVESFLCSLTEDLRAKIIYFKLSPSVNNYSMPSRSLPLRKKIQIDSLSTTRDYNWAWRCNRGLDVLTRIGIEQFTEQCLCPPSYYGQLCQYQNQRVSVTMKLRTELEDLRTVFAIVITIVDDHGTINSHEQIDYLSFRDCNGKFSFYLLYSTRPKKGNHTYSVRIDAYDKQSQEFRASWIFPLLFNFLPVHRLAVLLHISVHQARGCSLICSHGQCFKYENSDNFFCRCDRGWSGSQCTIKHQCNCSSKSLCVGPSMCVCQLGQFGPRCYLTRSSCWLGKCHNGGTCVPTDARMAEFNYTCICPLGYSGDQCQMMDSRIDISFDNNAHIPISILAHFITVRLNAPHIRTTMLKKIAIDQDTVILRTSIEFNIVFIEMLKNYYLIVLHEHQVSSINISIQIIPAQRCLHIRELFNTTLLQLHLLRRIKRYHLPCQERLDLPCYFDEIHMCLCNQDRHANCLEFEHNMTYDCEGSNFCENGAHCFRDDPTYPKTSVCVCTDCYYGTKCQFSTKGFSLSLDIILGYHIKPYITIGRQPFIIKISMALTIIMLIIGLISGFLSLLTFQAKKPREVGCGLYLLASSVTSIFTMIMFKIKFLLLFLSQTKTITNQTYLLFNCVSVDFLLQICLNLGNWLNACVAIERALTVIKGTNFDKKKSKRYAKWVIAPVIVLTVATALQDPIHRHLIDDMEEQRTWCVVSYSRSLQAFDTFMNLFHFLVPFSINLSSTLVIIIIGARQRSIARTQQTYKKHIREQFHQHKHLLISLIILVILSLPRLIISFISGCMKSARQPWLFLTTYFISFIPPVLNFGIFVLTSDMYKKEFIDAFKRLRRVL